MGCGSSQLCHVCDRRRPSGNQRWLNQSSFRLFWKTADLGLSRKEVTLLDRQWKNITQGKLDVVGSSVMRQCFEACPAMLDAFGWHARALHDVVNEYRFRKHAIVFQDTLALIIASAAKPDEDVGSLVCTLGTQHVHFVRCALEDEFWVTMGEALLAVMDSLTPATAAKRNTYLKIWKKFAHFVIASMHIGYLIGVKQGGLPTRLNPAVNVIEHEFMLLPLVPMMAAGCPARQPTLRKFFMQ